MTAAARLSSRSPAARSALVGATSYGPDPCGQPRPGFYTRLADEPILSSVQAAVQEIAGVDVVGTGGAPAG